VSSHPNSQTSKKRKRWDLSCLWVPFGAHHSGPKCCCCCCWEVERWRYMIFPQLQHRQITTQKMPGLCLRAKWSITERASFDYTHAARDKGITRLASKHIVLACFFLLEQGTDAYAHVIFEYVFHKLSNKYKKKQHQMNCQRGVPQLQQRQIVIRERSIPTGRQHKGITRSASKNHCSGLFLFVGWMHRCVCTRYLLICIS
jgi:hypothetical protein